MRSSRSLSQPVIGNSPSRSRSPPESALPAPVVSPETPSGSVPSYYSDIIDRQREEILQEVFEEDDYDEECDDEDDSFSMTL